MNAELYNDKYANLTTECARDICDMLIENNVKKIKFNRTDMKGIEPPTAVFYGICERCRKIKKINELLLILFIFFLK